MEFNVLLIAISGYKYPVSTQKTVSDTLLCWETYTIWLEWQVLDILDHVIHLDKSLTPHGSSTCTPLGDHPGLIKRVGWNTNALFTKATEAFPWVAMWELVSNLSYASWLQCLYTAISFPEMILSNHNFHSSVTIIYLWWYSTVCLLCYCVVKGLDL